MWVEITFSCCPGCGQYQTSKWRCTCGAVLEINEYGYIQCKNGHKHPFCHVKWRCPGHNNVYKAANKMYMASAMMGMVAAMSDTDFQWYVTLMSNINRQFDDDFKAPENYAARHYKNYEPISDNDDEKKVDYVAQIEREVRSIRLQPNTSREKIFNLAKKTYKKQGKPVIIDKDNTLREIRQNARNYKNVALPLTLAQDKPFYSWNEQQFKRDFSRKFNIPIQCIHVVSVKSGSTIIDLKLNTHTSGNKLLLPIECIAERISEKKAEKALVEFGIFAIEFGLPEAGFECLKQRIIMNPRWNREYGPSATDWDGPLNDGKSRGNEPYYCPKGWKRFAVQFKEQAYDFDNVYDKWPIAYHGTKFECSMLITLTGLRCSPGDHGDGVYLSPSIKYVSHPRYCTPRKLIINEREWRKQNIKQEQINEFKKYNGKWVQCAFMCRIKPGSYKRCKETMAYWTNFPHKNGVFDNIDINTIEWVVPGKEGTIYGNDKILIYGIMIRAKDTEQTGYYDY